ncbi:MAG: ABC transporter substrate-binding protein [Phycisphaeraceae bacterium]|nr:ABC transporter substrate-binding protein [Phycisphaeraceae bacterium]
MSRSPVKNSKFEIRRLQQRPQPLNSKFPIAAALCVLLLTGCGRQTPPADTDQRRIVTLAPALTQMVADLGVLDDVVGVAQHDPIADASLPVLGNFVQVDIERLLSVQPTLVMIMSGKEGVPPRLRELADAGRFQLEDYPTPTCIEDVLDTLHSMGAVLDCQRQADDLARHLNDQLRQVRVDVAPLQQPRVLMVIALHPIMASGPGTVNDSLLQQAGGINAAENATVPAPTFDREALLALQPDVILLMLPGAPPLTDHDDRLREFADVPVPAVRDGRIVLLNDPLIALPGTSLVATVRRIADAIHPKLTYEFQEDHE